MVGSSCKQYESIYAEISIEFQVNISPLFGQILILYPICQSDMIATDGTHKRNGRRVGGYRCKNPLCPFLETHPKSRGKQFVLTTSYNFRQIVWNQLSGLYEDLMIDGAKNKSVAKKYGVSQALISQN